MDAAALTESPFVEPHHDFFHRLRYDFQAALLVTTNRVLALLDDVAVPVGTAHVHRRACRLHRYNLVVFFNQLDDSPSDPNLE